MPLDLNITTIDFNHKDAINIVFIGDGFTSAQTATYHAKINSAINDFFSFEPFTGNRDKFNIYSIPTVSVDSGISIKSHPNNPLTPVVKNTFLGAYFNEGGMIRLTSFDKKEELEIELTRRFKNRPFVILISNASTYGGSGMYPDDRFMTVTQITMETQYNTFKEIMMHEFGHSFCGLADEYGGNCVSDKPVNFSLPLYDRPNVTNDIVNKRKWDNIVLNPQYIEGANYCNTGWWRSSQSSLMRGWFESGTLLDQQFNELSKYHIQKRIEEEIASNKKTKTYINNEIVKDRYNLKKRNNYKALRNIRINSDVVFDKSMICNSLFINKGCSLTINKGVTVRYKKIINNGTLINNGHIEVAP